jgi:hypothetical protein
MSNSGWLGPAGLSAFATALFAFIAFFKDTILRYLRRPKLRGELQRRPPDTSFVPALGGSKLAYFRLKVWNKGKTAADKVEVYARKLQLNEAGRVRDYNDFLPMNLAWSHLPEGENIYLQTIPPKTYKHCDLGQIGKLDVQVGSAVWNEVAPLNVLWKNTPDLSDSSTYFILSTQTPGPNYANYLPKGDYLLTVVLAASNAKPREIVIRIGHTGDVLAHMLIHGKGPFAEIVRG